ncbi:MAG: ABC transporter substrate binding protein [Thermodesulfobacteriota bacterium]|nr:ABC transporter substrate binding protein [Thermodesulfobacteriota bacterium]
MKTHCCQIIIFILFLILPGITSTARSADIVVVQNARIKPYQTALRSFQATIATIPGRYGKTIQPVQLSEIYLPDMHGGKSLAREILRRRPDLILAMGKKALAAVKDFQNIPIVYLLTPSVPQSLSRQRNITGVEMKLSAAAQLREVRKRLPQVKQIGILYDPRYSADFIREAETAAAQLDLTLISRRIKSSKEVLAGLNDLGSEIDLLWMAPDLTVATPQGVEALFLFAMENRIPVLTFADKYLKSGALLSVSFDIQAMGDAAAILAKKILSGIKVQEITPVISEKVKITINEKIAAQLKIKINPEITP